MKESTRIEFNKLDPGIKEEYEDLIKRGVDFDLEAKHKRYYENTNLEFLKWRSDIFKRWKANYFYPLNTN